MRYFIGIFSALVFSCGTTLYNTSSYMASTPQNNVAGLPQNTYNNTMEEQLEQLEEEDQSIDLSYDLYSPVEVMISEDTETKSNKSGAEPVKQEFDHITWDELLKKHVSESGKVNYKGFLSDWNTLRSYIQELSTHVPDSNNERQEVLAYWINAYNALTIDLILRHYPVKSIKDIDQPWKQKNWKLGEKWYDLDEIEHKILRKMEEPRMHFAIVCASYSCPNLLNKAYNAQDLDEQLNMVTKAFLADPSKNKIAENSIEISKIFQWFAQDFKKDGSLIDFLNRYSEVKISENAKKRFKDYDWKLNE